jgi:hypothetical protein
MPDTPRVCPKDLPRPDRAARQARVKASLGRRRYAAEARRILRGHELACWCPSTSPATPTSCSRWRTADRRRPEAGSQRLRAAEARRPGLPVGHAPVGGSGLSCQRPGTSPRRLP